MKSFNTTLLKVMLGMLAVALLIFLLGVIGEIYSWSSPVHQVTPVIVYAINYVKVVLWLMIIPALTLIAGNIRYLVTGKVITADDIESAKTKVVDFLLNDKL